MGKHAKYSPSSGHRYMNCPPALLLEEQFPDEESPYAAEGTAGHKLAEHLIKKHLKIRSRRPTSDYYSDELLEAVDEYVQYVIEQIEEAKHICSDPVFSVEQKVDLSFHVKDCFGTADMVIVTDKKVHIIDLKLGKGVQVDAENNTQLMIYGLGMLDIAEMLFDIETVELTIVQPRISHFSTWKSQQKNCINGQNRNLNRKRKWRWTEKENTKLGSGVVFARRGFNAGQGQKSIFIWHRWNFHSQRYYQMKKLQKCCQKRMH